VSAPTPTLALSLDSGYISRSSGCPTFLLYLPNSSNLLLTNITKLTLLIIRKLFDYLRERLTGFVEPPNGNIKCSEFLSAEHSHFHKNQI
jgi:hypothetical protein